MPGCSGPTGTAPLLIFSVLRSYPHPAVTLLFIRHRQQYAGYHPICSIFILPISCGSGILYYIEGKDLAGPVPEYYPVLPLLRYSFGRVLTQTVTAPTICMGLSVLYSF